MRYRRGHPIGDLAPEAADCWPPTHRAPGPAQPQHQVFGDGSGSCYSCHPRDAITSPQYTKTLARVDSVSQPTMREEGCEKRTLLQSFRLTVIAGPPIPSTRRQLTCSPPADGLTPQRFCDS